MCNNAPRPSESQGCRLKPPRMYLCKGVRFLDAWPTMGWECHGLQDVSGGKPVRLQGTELPLYGMEIDVAAAAEEIRSIGKESDGSQVRGAHVSWLALVSGSGSFSGYPMRHTRAIWATSRQHTPRNAATASHIEASDGPAMDNQALNHQAQAYDPPAYLHGPWFGVWTSRHRQMVHVLCVMPDGVPHCNANGRLVQACVLVHGPVTWLSCKVVSAEECRMM